jgi:hypothetical protein
MMFGFAGWADIVLGRQWKLTMTGGNELVTKVSAYTSFSVIWLVDGQLLWYG